jgi:hypothetical protein
MRAWRGWVLLGSVAALLFSACGPSEECEDACTKLQFCMSFFEHCNEDINGKPIECSGATLCGARCTNASSCEAFKDAFSGMPTETSKEVLACWARCSTEG